MDRARQFLPIDAVLIDTSPAPRTYVARIFDAGIDLGIDDSAYVGRECAEGSAHSPKTRTYRALRCVGYEQTRQTVEALRRALSETGESSGVGLP